MLLAVFITKIWLQRISSPHVATMKSEITSCAYKSDCREFMSSVWHVVFHMSFWIDVQDPSGKGKSKTGCVLWNISFLKIYILRLSIGSLFLSGSTFIVLKGTFIYIAQVKYKASSDCKHLSSKRNKHYLSGYRNENIDLKEKMLEGSRKMPDALDLFHTFRTLNKDCRGSFCSPAIRDILLRCFNK